MCALMGEGRQCVCHQAALSWSFESFQVINGKQSADNNSQASQMLFLKWEINNMV